MGTDDTFFDYQERRLAILQNWGLASVLLGVFAAKMRDPLPRQFGLQAATWGAIDAGLAIFGRGQARRKAQRRAQGELSDEKLVREMRTFRSILLVNAALDVGYIAIGLWLIRAAPEDKRRARQGMGSGIVVQGAFLLLYDALLAHEVHHDWLTTTQPPGGA
jgi:hypothetical protein